MVNWKTFEAKYDKREQWAFEQMSYWLFCIESNNKIGLFRYKNQAGIETEPIEKDGVFYGFQAKYYTTSLSGNKKDIIDSIRKAKTKNNRLNVIYLYINQELSESKKADKKKPKYQIDIEQAAKNIEIEIEWRVPSHLEYQLSQPQNKWIFDIFFGSNGLDPDFFEKQVEKEIINLGPRFNEKLNFELPIAQIFNNVAHDEIFYKRFITIIDKWLTEKSYRKLKDNEHLSELEKELESLKDELTNWVNSFMYSLNNSILLTDFLAKLQQFNIKVEDKRDTLYKQKDWKNSPNKFDNELGRLRKIKNDNDNFLENIEKLKINLTNNSTLIIQGEAGCGKSHLLGDIATQRKNQFLPTILLLGTTFNNSNTIEKNVLDKLDLTCSFNDLFTNLNSMGLSINTRVLILIDAINEGAGVDLWKNQIAGFINEVAKYPAVGLVLTIRSTYFHDIIPVNFETNPNITIITHEGFKGNEYEALKLFCKHYDLKLPNFPILNPEFTNPLFLHTICEAVKDLPDKSFPKGFYGINKTYSLYKNSLNKKFEEKRPEYKYQDVVSKAIEKLAVVIFDTEYHSLNISEAVELFNTGFPRFPFLLSDLIEESVLIKTKNEYDRKNPKEIVFFSYQRLGDFFMAEELLKRYSTKEDLKNAFANDTKFQKITNEYHWSYKGIVEAFSILFPEKYDLELFELIDFFFDKNTDKRNEKWLMINTYKSFTQILLNSLKWRELSSIDEKKVSKWLKKNGSLEYKEWLCALTELAAIPEHPFNSDRLHIILSKYSMPDRDNFWQKYLLYCSGYNNDNIAFPLRRLIDWAWTPNISISTDTETARLVAQTLTWVLSSTNISLRDQTTKALVNLLEQKSEVLITILKVFKKVDDLYILERLHAVAYGCILRTEKEKSIKVIAQYIYNTIFKDQNPPAHILLRDYARNAVEYAIYKNVGLEIEPNLIRPPYNTKMPILPQSEGDVKKYKLDYESPNFKQTYGYEQNSIYNSVIAGIADFGHYIVESAVRHFASFSFREDMSYSHFLKKLKKDQRDLIKLIFEYKKQKYDFNKKFEYQKRNGIQCSDIQKKFIDALDDIKKYWIKEKDNLFDSKQVDYIDNTILPYFERKIKGENFNPRIIIYWIVKRVFELGYNRELHGEYDSSIRSFYNYNRHENKVERIGKKYQWIAFYEIMANLADNYKIKDGWSSDNNYEFYKGAWQFYLRNIDPAYITKNNDDVENDIIKITKEWWENEEYTQWNYPDSEWVKTIDDLIDPKRVIEKKDANNKEWLHLQHFVEWNEPKKIGIDKYEGKRKQIFYIIQGLLVKKSNKQKIVNYLKNQNFWGGWLPENRDDYSKLINREKFWSPAYIDTYKKDKKIWKTIQDTKYKVIVTTEFANSGIENDKSGANQSYNIPCKYIFEGMKLQYAQIDGNLKNANGDIIVTNNNSRGILIRKKELIRFLDDNNLDIIWTLLGEKFSFIDKRDEESYFKVPCGVFYIESGNIEGEIKMYDRD